VVDDHLTIRTPAALPHLNLTDAGMVRSRIKFLVLAIIFSVSACLPLSFAQQGNTPGGLILQIQGIGFYKDDFGREHRTVSENISITIQTVSLLFVTPNETEPSLQIQSHQEVTRAFQVCNGGNDAEKVVVSQLDLPSPARLVNFYFDNDRSGTITASDQAIQVGETLSPSLEPGSCVGVLVTVNSENFSAQTNLTIRLTARTTTATAANGIQEATGQIVNLVIGGARISGPGEGLPLLLINTLAETVATANQVLTFSIALRNSGDITAEGIIFVHDLSDGLEYLTGSLKLNSNTSATTHATVEATSATSHVEFGIPPLAPGQSVQFEYQVRVKPGVAGRGLVNYGGISGHNFASTRTTETVILIDPFGVVFAARGGLSMPIAGASVALVSDTSGNSPVSIPPGAGLPPNAENSNPDIADANGRYNFRLRSEQLGTTSSEATYYLKASAPGFMVRMLKVSLTPTHSGLFQATFSGIDGQAIAGADGFSLVRDAVTLEDLGSLAPNIPMFETYSLEIDKSVDRQRAQIGDVLSYTINIHNPTSATITGLVLRDTLPPSFIYAQGTTTTQTGNTTAGAEPSRVKGELILKLGEIAAAGRIQIKYRVRIGANAREGDQFNQAVATGKFSNGDPVRTDAARVSVRVGAGVFSTRQIILGRVFEDTNRNRYFDHDDKPIDGARVYLMNGQYVLTDAAGLYNFPNVGDGAAVIALDPVSIPAGLKLEDDGPVSGRSWARLLRTPLSGGALFHQDFALARKAIIATAPKSPPSSFEKGKPVLVKAAGQPALPAKSFGAGTYEIASTEKIPPVKPGEALVLSPASPAAAVTSGSPITVRVAIDWTVLLEINGKPVSDKNIGETRVDRANQITTYTFAGLTLPPGPNEVRVTAIGPTNEHGVPVTFKVMGRGPVRRIEIVTERKELASGGKDSMPAMIRAFDQWGNPALDGLVAIEAVNVQIMADGGASQSQSARPQSFGTLPSLDRNRIDLTQPFSATIEKDSRSQIVVALTDGEARIRLVAPGTATSAHLKAVMLQAVGELDIRILAEKRPTLLVGLAEASFGNVPAAGLNEDTARYRGRLAFFLRATIRVKNILTLSYDSHRPINRIAGQDRLFQLDPLERAYPIFGDSSMRFEQAQSNSKLYARIDRGRSYAMFGDYDADMKDLALTGYARKLTGVKLHLEDRAASFITVTGARPNTSFARDVIPGGSLSLIQLSHGDILPGSETVTLEVRDRRNPEIILTTETLIRSVDYNLDAISGQIFLMRFISAFDYALNLTQIVVTYEHSANGFNSLVLTARGLKKFPGIGLQLGFTGIYQRQDQLSDFSLSGIDVTKNLPRGGLIKGAVALGRGEIAGFSNGGFASESNDHNGFAYEIDYTQPVSFREGVLHGRLAGASAGFLNPFGTTVTPGSRRAELSFSFKPRRTSTAKVSFTDERNETDNVDNSRSTFSFAWSEALRENLKLHFGYDFREFSDNKGDRDITSNLFTLGAEWRPTNKLELRIKREQNFGSSDPSYPNQTTLGATYQLTDWAKLFFTQRIASAPIIPIADTNGFALSSTRSETAFGVETKLSRFTSMTGRYQIDNGANSTDSFAVIGLVNRLPINKELSLELGYERGFHLKGEGKSFNSITVGAAWQPKDNFIANARYELRDRNGAGHLFVVGAAGRINESITALSRFQFARIDSEIEKSRTLDGEAALAIRPATNDRVGLLFSYKRRSRATDGTATALRDRIDTFSTDGFYQLTPHLELSGRVAARLSANGQGETPYVSTVTYLTQGRAQYRFAERFDFAAELRAMLQPKSGTAKRSYGAEFGFWALPDLRFGVGYNFANSMEPAGVAPIGARRGFYFNISTKLSNLFDLFGRSRERQPKPQTSSTESEQTKR
jgi:uncharacterized repeat protein (TIGR01451 family)